MYIYNLDLSMEGELERIMILVIFVNKLTFYIHSFIGISRVLYNKQNTYNVDSFIYIVIGDSGQS